MHQLRGRDEKLPNVVCMHQRYRVPEGLGGVVVPWVEEGKVKSEVERGMWWMIGGEVTVCRAAAVVE